MTDWYKMDPIDWNDGTEDLSLEQEAAYLRICHAIYITERPVRDNPFVVAGLLRCNERKAKRLLSELVEAGKLVVENGLISNRRAVEVISNRNQIRTERKSAGSRGGVESGKARSKSLENNETGQAIASVPNEPDKIRLEENISPISPSKQKRFANPSIILQSVVDTMAAQSFVGHLEEKGKPLTSHSAEALVETLREVKQLGGNPTEAIRLAIRKGWATIEIEYLRNSGFKFTTSPAAASVNWTERIKAYRDNGTWPHSWGPKPDEPGCRAPRELMQRDMGGKAA